MRFGGQSYVPAALFTGKRRGTHCIGGWVGPKAYLDGCGKLRPHLAVLGVGMRSLGCWNCGFDSHRKHGVSVACFQAEVSASGSSLVERIRTVCGVSECDREASIMTRPWSTTGSCAIKEIVYEGKRKTERYLVVNK
jgi:hypothetical protein